MEFSWNVVVFLILTLLIICYIIHCCTAPRNMRTDIAMQGQAAPFGKRSPPPSYRIIEFPATYSPQNNLTMPLAQPISAAQSTSAVMHQQRRYSTEPPPYELVVAIAKRDYQRRGSFTPRFSF